MERRNVAVAVFVVAVLVSHLAVLTFVHQPQSRMLFSNLLQLVAAWGACAFALWTAFRSREDVREAWLLVGITFLLWGCGQAGWTYQEWLRGPRHPAQEPTDLFFFFSVTPMLMLLTLRESTDRERFDWARLLDGVQVGIL